MHLRLVLMAIVLMALSGTTWANDANEAGEEIVSTSETEDVTSRGSGGRVIEFGKGEQTPGGVVNAKVQQNPLAKENEEKKASRAEQGRTQSGKQGNSVKLITGGDPSDGNAKSGHLPILD